jgi:hypothetical protein
MLRAWTYDVYCTIWFRQGYAQDASRESSHLQEKMGGLPASTNYLKKYRTSEIRSNRDKSRRHHSEPASNSRQKRGTAITAAITVAMTA